MMTIVVIPTYNESDNIRSLVSEILKIKPELPGELGIVIVDDNSPDGTGQIADELAQHHPEVKVIHRPAKLGLGTAHIAGFKRSLAEGASFVISMDADFSHHPRYIPDIVRDLDRFQVVIGSRYVKGGGTLKCGRGRKILSRGANAFAKRMLGLRARDCTAGFRGYRREVLEALDLDSIFSNGYSFLIEILHRCQELGYQIGEVPIIFEDRRQGKSKISRREIIRAVYTVLRLRSPGLPWEAWRSQYHKLRSRPK